MTVVTINYNDYKTVIKFIDEIKLYNNIDHIIIVDNCSTDNSYQYLLGFLSEKVKVIQSERNGGGSFWIMWRASKADAVAAGVFMAIFGI